MSSKTERPPHSAFVEKSNAPTRAAVRSILGGCGAAWADLEGHVTGTYRFASEFHFMYGPRYGWALRFRRGDRLVLAMYPNRDRFTLQVILGPEQLAKAAGMGLSQAITKAIASAKPYPEGRWLFIPVTSVRGARDMRPLVALKVSRQVKGGGGAARGSGVRSGSTTG